MDGLYELYLANNRLTGEIPPELGDLGPRLRRLSLRGNQLTGEIPPELGDIRDLEVLDLRNNNLTGQIPAELDNPRNIGGLYLGDNRFTGCIPDTFKTVRYNDILLLNLPLCGGGALPGDITSRALIALFNSTGGHNWHDDTNWGSSGQTSSWYGVSNRADRNPRHVTMLQLPENNLTGELPPELGNLGSLSILDLRGNSLTGQIPAELGNLHLNILRLSGNRFTGCMPDDLESITDNDLSELDLPFCSVKALPHEEFDPALQALYNATGGDNWHDNTKWFTNQPLGEWFGVRDYTDPNVDSSRHVKGIVLRENNLTGEIPTELGNLDSMQTLDLSGNSLTGQIPAELGNLSSLRYLNLVNNQLTGGIPSTFPYLAFLDLSGNNLTGQIPARMNHRRLTHLYLGGNQFTGCIPAGLRRVGKNDLDTLGLPFCGQ